MFPVQESDKLLKSRRGFTWEKDTTRYGKVLRMQWIRNNCRPNIELHFDDFMAINYMRWDSVNRCNIAKLVRSRLSELRSTNSTEQFQIQEASGNMMKTL